MKVQFCQPVQQARQDVKDDGPSFSGCGGIPIVQQQDIATIQVVHENLENQIRIADRECRTRAWSSCKGGGPGVQAPDRVYNFASLPLREKKAAAAR